MTTAEIFQVLSSKIDTNHENMIRLLTSIEAQTTKTNGRVNCLEVKVWELEKDEIMHEINCPQAPKIAALEKENEDIRMMKKYPQITFFGFIGLVAVCIYLVAMGYNKVNTELTTIQDRQQQILNEKTSPMKK